MRKDTVFIHVFPKHVWHKLDDGASCWCEPIVTHTLRPSKPDLTINVCVHSTEQIDTEIAVVNPSKNTKIYFSDDDEEDSDAS